MKYSRCPFLRNTIGVSIVFKPLIYIIDGQSSPLTQSAVALVMQLFGLSRLIAFVVDNNQFGYSFIKTRTYNLDMVIFFKAD